MDLRQLRYFLAVAEELHFARAAARVGIEQSPLSTAIRNFESDLGMPLFGRTSRRTWLLPAGEILLRHTRQILAAVDEARESLELLRTGQTGSLKFGLAPGTASTALRKLLQRFCAAHPEVAIAIQDCTLTQQLILLETHALDVGIAFESTQAARFTASPSGASRWSRHFPWAMPGPRGHVLARRTS